MEDYKEKYEQLSAAYNKLAEESRMCGQELFLMRTDRTLQKLTVMMDIIKDKDKYSPDIVELANEHMRRIMAIPKDEA